MFKKKKDKYLDNLILDITTLRVEEIGVEKSKELLENYFSQVKGRVVEFKKKVSSPYMNLLRRWHCSEESPLTKKGITIGGIFDNIVYLEFENKNSKKFSIPFYGGSEFAIIGDILYLSMMRVNKTGNLEISQQNIYIPEDTSRF